MSNEAGRYTIGDVGGAFDLKISKDGYETDTQRVGPVSENLTFDAAIAPIVRTLVGIVTETPPTETTPIGGAKVAIVSGSNKGQSVTTDGNGYYSMAGVWGDFDVLVSSGGYEVKTVQASVNESVKRLDVRLTPDDQPIQTVFTGTLCTVADPLVPGGGVIGSRCVTQPFPYPTQIHHRLPVHRPGIMTVAADYDYQGDYYENFLSFEVRCGSQLIASKKVEKGNVWPRRPVWHPDGTDTVQIALPQACAYEVKLFNYISDVKGGDWTTYRVELKHPK